MLKGRENTGSEKGWRLEEAAGFLSEGEGRAKRSSQREKKYMKSERISNGAKKRYRLSKSERIIRNYEYKRVYEQGTSYRDGVFILTIVKNKIGHHRVGISIKRSKVPLSSNRNNIKRLIKEAFRLNKLRLKNGPYDIVISIIKPPPQKINYLIVEQRFHALLKKARAL